MRTGLIRGWRSVRSRAGNDSGAAVIIVVLTLMAIMAMLMLTIDVGGLLLKRRALVNASDAAALAAAKSCADTADTYTPESRADIYAASNVDGLVAENGGITEIVGCDAGRGHVTVEYSHPQSLFFAGVFGFGSEGSVTTDATAAWGPASSGFAIPIVLDSGYLQGTCKVPDGIKIGDKCNFWYNNGDSTLGDANWGFMNLDEWDVVANAQCPNGGASDRDKWIVTGYPDLRVLNGEPAGSEPTYVCRATGAVNSNWKTLEDERGKVKLFPVNDCAGQLDKDGVVSPCPSTPHKYDIIGFTSLLISEVYDGNDPAAIGTPGASDICEPAISAFDTGDTWDLSSSYVGIGGCPSTTPDTVSASSVHISPTKPKGPEYIQCAPNDFAATCAYWYDATARSIAWRTAPATDLKVEYGWSMNGTPGACGIHPSDPNAKCVVTEWRGFSTTGGTIGQGEDFGVSAFALCEFELGSCPEEE